MRTDRRGWPAAVVPSALIGVGVYGRADHGSASVSTPALHFDGAGAEGEGGEGGDENFKLHDGMCAGVGLSLDRGTFPRFVRMYILYHI